MSTIGGIVRDHRGIPYLASTCSPLMVEILFIREGIAMTLQYIKDNIEIELNSMEAVRALQTQTMVGSKLFFAISTIKEAL